MKQILAKPIQLVNQVTKGADDVSNFKAESVELKVKTEKLVMLLRQAACASSNLYGQPLHWIIDETEQALDKALTLVVKCCTNSIMKRVFTIIPTRGVREFAMKVAGEKLSMATKAVDVKLLSMMEVATTADGRGSAVIRIDDGRLEKEEIR